MAVRGLAWDIKQTDRFLFRAQVATEIKSSFTGEGKESGLFLQHTFPESTSSRKDSLVPRSVSWFVNNSCLTVLLHVVKTIAATGLYRASHAEHFLVQISPIWYQNRFVARVIRNTQTNAWAKLEFSQFKESCNYNNTRWRNQYTSLQVLRLSKTERLSRSLFSCLKIVSPRRTGSSESFGLDLR